jgi:hypothetical protein
MHPLRQSRRNRAHQARDGAVGPPHEVHVHVVFDAAESCRTPCPARTMPQVRVHMIRDVEGDPRAAVPGAEDDVRDNPGACAGHGAPDPSRWSNANSSRRRSVSSSCPRSASPSLQRPAGSSLGTSASSTLRRNASSSLRRSVIPSLQRGVIPSLQRGVIPSLQRGVIPSLQRGVIPSLRRSAGM